MKKSFIILGIASLAMFGTSCTKELLEQDNPTATTDEKWWNLESDLQSALGTIYGGLPSGTYAYFTNARMHMAGMTDEAVHGGNFGDWRNYPLGLATSQTGSARELYSLNYSNIRRACRFLEHYQKAYVENQELKSRYAAEARALRAWYHLELFLMYGEIPIVNHTLSPGESFQAKKSRAEIIDFISAELDTSAAGLPPSYSDDEAWRISKGACYAMQAILHINAGNWDKAAEASEKVIGLGVYDLHKATAAGVNSYADLFSYNAMVNKERILYRAGAQSEVFFRNAPKSLGCQSTTNPTAAIVNAYETLQGKTLAELGPDSLNIYRADPAFKNNRDPRLRVSVLLPGETFVNRKLLPFDRTPGNPDMIGLPQSTTTGFWMKKYLDPKDASSTYSGRQHFMIIRYAEILLIRVEALIEGGKWQHADVVNYLNEIRQRAGMPNVNTAVYNSEVKLRELVRRERQVELAFEGQRLFDIRRWKIGSVLNGSLEGAVDPETGKPVIVEVRKFDPKRDYLWPIPLAETNANPNMKQNEGW